MKAVVCYGDNIVKYEDIPEPLADKDEVKIKVKACGICGSDISRAVGHSAHHYPIVLGHEFCGVVEEVADTIDNIKKGDKVVVAPLIPCNDCEDCKNGNYSLCSNYSFIGSRQQGAMAEYIVVPRKNVLKISDSISFEQGALFEPATVALHALYQNKYEANGTVAIFGGGTIGVFILQWVKILGCKKVVVFGRDKKHLELSKRLGADAVISTLDNDFMEQAMTFTEGKGFDYVFESAGSNQTIKLAFEFAGKKSHVCLVGTPTKEISFSVKEWEMINRKEFYLTGSWMSYSAPFPGKEWEMTSKHFENGDLKYDEEIFHKKFMMSNASDAFNLFKADRAKIKGRVILIQEL